MTKRERQLYDYISDQNIDLIKQRIEFINKEIRNLDNERFYLTTKLFNIQNKKYHEDE